MADVRKHALTFIEDEEALGRKRDAEKHARARYRRTENNKPNGREHASFL